MQKTWVLGIVLATLVNTGCDKTSDHKDPVPAPTPSSTPLPPPQPQPIVDPLPYDKPAPGFTFEDLLKGSYCTVKLKDDVQTYLLADVLGTSASVILFTYYLPKAGDFVYHSEMISTFSLESSNCDLAQLTDEWTTPVLVAPLHFYADKTFSGEPTCSIEPGPSPFEDNAFDSTSGNYVGAKLKSSDLCKGLTYAYLKSIPNIVNLHLAPR